LFETVLPLRAGHAFHSPLHLRAKRGGEREGPEMRPEHLMFVAGNIS
jgi:hypothetical protein